MTETYTLHIPGLLASTNSTRRRHWSVENEITTEWRHAAKVIAREAKVPPLDRVTIRVTPLQARGRLADAGAYAVQVKGVVDGLVDARVIPDDGPEHVAELALMPSVRSKAEGLRVEIVEVEREAGGES